MVDKSVIHELIAYSFQDEDENPLILTGGQLDIASAILDPEILRARIATPTQYGKSMTVALAALLCKYLPFGKQKILIVAPSSEQSQIIMNYVITYVLQNRRFQDGLLNVETVQRLKTQFSKDRLAWADGSEIRILTANASVASKNINLGGKQLMGHGGTLIIVDESSLIPDIIMGKILRMLGKSKNGKLILIGNPFNQNFFYKASLKPEYHQILIDWRQAVAEGRYTLEFVEEMRASMDPDLFKILYDVVHILGSENSFIKNEDIEEGARRRAELLDGDPDYYKKLEEASPIKVGVDVARGGGDFTRIYIRKGAKTIRNIEMNTRNIMEIANRVVLLQSELNFDWENVSIDATGIGVGVVDRLEEQDYEVNAVFGAANPDNEQLYYNKRAELWGMMREGIRSGTLDIIQDEAFKGQAVSVERQYRTRKGYVVQKLESKEDLKKRDVKSPDIADAVALSYYEDEGYYAEVSTQSYL